MDHEVNGPGKANLETDEPSSEMEALSVEPLSAAQLQDLKSRAAKADENWQRLLRATADLDNFRKRSVRDKEEAVRFANESLIKKLVGVLDNFDMAQAAAQAQPDNPQSLQAGVAMIYSQLRQVLMDAGLEEVDATGKAFDPNLHEAVSQQESADVPDGQVVQQLRKGYKLRDRLVRPATVIVSKRPGA